ncbi:MAG: Ger(x)C family spore germination protein [Halanaerobiaceae bacterium]
MKRIHKKIILSLLIGILIAINGCWDAKEYEQLALIKGIGISIADEEDRIKFSVQFARREDEEGASNTPQLAESMVTSSTGYTLFEANRNLINQLGLRPFYGHNEIIIIDEEIARREVNIYLDYFIRNKEIRGRTTVAFTRDDPEEILNKPHYMSNISATNIDNMLNGISVAGTIINSKLLNFKECLLNKYMDPAAAQLELRPGGPEDSASGDNLVFSSGGVIFKGDRLVDWLTRREARGYNWVHAPSNIRGPIVVNTEDQEYSKKISIQVYRGSTKVKPSMENGIFQIDIEVKTEGFIIEKMDPEYELIVEKHIDQLEKRFAQVIENEILSTLAIGRANNADILGLADTIYKKFPRELDKIESSWEEIYQEIPVTIKVISDIRRTGMLK